MSSHRRTILSYPIDGMSHSPEVDAYYLITGNHLRCQVADLVGATRFAQGLFCEAVEVSLSEHGLSESRCHAGLGCSWTRAESESLAELVFVSVRLVTW